MTLDLKGRSVLVTGGSRGIGLAIAKKLSEAGASVMICGRSTGDIETAVEAIRQAGPAGSRAHYSGCAADVSNEPSVGELFGEVERRLGGLDILVNNAGVGIFKNLAVMDPKEWRTVLGTNLDGIYYSVHHALPLLLKSTQAWIVNIASLAGKNAFAGGAAYNASKFGLCGMSEAMMLDHRYDNVRVTTILPGSVSTQFGTSGQAEWKIAPEDIAETVSMVLSMPGRTLISHVEVRPSRPPRKG